MNTCRLLTASLVSLSLALPNSAQFPEGDIFICDRTNSRVYRVDPVTDDLEGP